MKVMYNNRVLNVIHMLKKLVTSIILGSIAIFMGLSMLAYSTLLQLINKINLLCGENKSIAYQVLGGVIGIAILLSFIDALANAHYSLEK